MKKINGILVLCFILTSCYSYRPIKEGESVALGKKHQIRSIENKRENLTIWEMGDTIKGISESGKRREIPSGNVIEVRKRKFSTIKSVLLMSSIVGVIYVATIDWSWGEGDWNFDPRLSPE